MREYLAALQIAGMLDKVQGSANVLRAGSRADGALYALMVRSGQITTAQIDEARELYETGMIGS